MALLHVFLSSPAGAVGRILYRDGSPAECIAHHVCGLKLSGLSKMLASFQKTVYKGDQEPVTASLRQHLLDAGVPVYDENGSVSLKVLGTGYSSSVIETDNTPFITAANTRTRPGVVALSRDLLQRYTPGAPFDFGDRIHIAGLGEYSVEDSMNRRWTKRIDIWFPSRSEAFYFGKKNLYRSKLSPES